MPRAALRPPYDTPAWRAVLGLPPIHIRYAVQEVGGRLHITTTVAGRDALLQRCPDAITWRFTIPVEECPAEEDIKIPQEDQQTLPGVTDP